MDMLMPIMDGVEATQKIMQNSPCAILIVTTSTERNIAKVYAAMGYGALDVVDTPIVGHEDSASMANKLLAKISTISKLIKNTPTNTKSKLVNCDARPERQIDLVSQVSLVAIGSSTGGPKALATILSQLPLNFGAAIAIVQHVDCNFSSGFAEWLNQQTPLTVRLAVTGDRLQKGTVLIAGTNDHLYLKSDLTLGYTKNPVDYPYRPSVDVFFKSLAQHWKSKGIGILLTGMGKDGADGLSALKQQGWHTIAQNKESCIVYGMPRAAVELNAAVQVLTPEAIASKLVQKSYG
jgi:two-component system response regulator WspF